MARLQARRARAHPCRHRRRRAGRVVRGAARRRRDLRDRGQRGQARVPARAAASRTSSTRARWTSPTRSWRITRGRGVDVVLNSLAGEAIAKGLSVLAPLGRFLEIGKADIYRNGDLALEHFSRNLSFFAIQVDLLLRHRPRRPARDDAGHGGRHRGGRTGAAAHAGVLRVARCEDGLRTLAQARHVGKVVIVDGRSRGRDRPAVAGGGHHPPRRDLPDHRRARRRRSCAGALPGGARRASAGAREPWRRGGGRIGSSWPISARRASRFCCSPRT